MFRKSTKTETAKTTPEKNKHVFREIVTNMRIVSRKANNQVSTPMDTAIVSGGIVGGNVKVIQGKTHELHDQISNASSAIDQIASNVRNFNGLIERQNTILSQTGTAVEKMSESAKGVSEITKQELESAGRLQKTIKKGGQDVMTTSHAISEVTAALGAVADVIKVIDDIAAQTNLLAMNAAIEAAHAGEQGKGFAVVAAEVRKLAESTTENSKAITESLQKIITQIRSAKEAGENAGSTFSNIQKEVDKFVEAFSQISQSTSELFTGTQQIDNSMGDLEQISSEISSGSKEMAVGSDDIDASLRKIKDFSTGLVDDMNNIEEKIYDISGAQSGIAQYMVDTNKSIEGFYRNMEESGELLKEEVLFNYDLILLMHRNWLIQLRAFLDNRKEGLKATSEDHLKCDLGRWIYGEGKHFEENQNYKKLEAQHKLFHEKAGEIIQSKTEGRKSQAEEKYQELMDDYHQVVSLLDQLKLEKL